MVGLETYRRRVGGVITISSNEISSTKYNLSAFLFSFTPNEKVKKK
jgi:hypothetical protein